MNLLKNFANKYTSIITAFVCSSIITTFIMFSYVTFGTLLTTLFVFIIILELYYYLTKSLLL